MNTLETVVLGIAIPSKELTAAKRELTPGLHPGGEMLVRLTWDGVNKAEDVVKPVPAKLNGDMLLKYLLSNMDLEDISEAVKAVSTGELEIDPTGLKRAEMALDALKLTTVKTTSGKTTPRNIKAEIVSEAVEAVAA
jgi:hypothetical protein